MSKRASKNIKETIKATDVLADLTPVTCEAVTAFRVSPLLSKSVSLTIVNGVVVDVKELTRAENTNNIAISKAVKEIWKIFRTQTDKTFLGGAFETPWVLWNSYIITGTYTACSWSLRLGQCRRFICL